MSSLSILKQPAPEEIRAAIIRHLAGKLCWRIARVTAFVAALSTDDICRCLNIEAADTLAELAARGCRETPEQAVA